MDILGLPKRMFQSLEQMSAPQKTAQTSTVKETSPTQPQGMSSLSERLDNLARNFVTQDQSSWSGCSASNHMLIAPTNVRGNDLQDYAVLTMTITQY